MKTQVVTYKFANYPKIHIVVPCKKNDDYMIALNSLANQTFKDFHVHIVHDENSLGANYARNIGFNSIKKKSKYILFSDADIKWEVDAIESMFNFLENHKDISYCFGMYEMDNKIYCKEKFSSIILKYNIASTMSLIRTKDFPKFDNNIQRLQDWDLWLCMYFNGHYGENIEKLIFTTKKRAGITNGLSISYLEAEKIIFEKWNLSEAVPEIEFEKCVNIGSSKNTPFNSVKKMVDSCFEVDNDSIVVLGYNDSTFNIDDFRLKYGKKVIIYQLEQLAGCKSDWYNPNSTSEIVIKNTKHVKSCLEKCDEIWEYDINNYNFIKNVLKLKHVKHKPLVYCEELKRKNNHEKQYDILFYGALNNRRVKYLEYLMLNSEYSIKIITHECYKKMFSHSIIASCFTPENSLYSEVLFDYIFQARIVLNIHYYDCIIQEQVRLFELIINDVLIVSEASKTNYFKEMIYEFNNENDMIETIDNAIKNRYISEKFKTQ